MHRLPLDGVQNLQTRCRPLPEGRMNPRVPTSCRVYTPAVLASALVGALKDEPRDLWLEPCFGQGAFLQALSTVGVSPRGIGAVCLDKRECAADRCATLGGGTELR